MITRYVHTRDRGGCAELRKGQHGGIAPCTRGGVYNGVVSIDFELLRLVSCLSDLQVG